MADLGTPDQRVISHDSTIDEHPRQRGALQREWSAPSLRLICFLAALFMISETATASLFLGQKFAAGDYPRSVAVADLNDDTVPDLVTANVYSDTVSVLLNLTAPPTECEFIGSLPRSTFMLAAFQDNTCENWSGISQPAENLQSAVLTKADLSFANLNGALLVNVTLTGASLDGASLVNTDMTNAILDSAIVTNAGMSFSNLSGADLSNADLTSADLSFATLTGTQYDEFTVFPSGKTYDIPPWGLDGGIEPWNAGMIPVPEPSYGLLLLCGALGLAGLAATRGEASEQRENG
jgi:hypothetical protein